MPRVCKVVGIDHISIRVRDYEKSKAFYGKLFDFLGFEISDEYPDAIGWTNGKTRYWISPAEGRKITAERADHDLRAEQVIFQGTPVVLEDAKGGTLRGAQAVYSTNTGKVRVTGTNEPLPAATPTP